MGISFKGRTPDWQYWVFDIDGREWVAVNQSTPQPLSIQFQGRYQNWPASLPVTKEGGFDILSSITTGTSDIDEKRGTVEWLWNGTRYKSSWAMFGLEEIIAAYEDSPAVWNYHLKFIGQVPYDGPTGGGVGTGVTSQATIEASKQITPSAQLSNERPVTQSPVPSAPYGGPSGSGYVEPPAQKPVGTGVASPEVIKAQQEVNTGPSGSGYTAPKVVEVPSAPYGGPSGSGYTKPKMVEVPSTLYGGPSGSGYTKSSETPPSTGGTDWVKLGLQLGAAYLLIS
jgi:hypothetical protein